jgi:hypothetical protein
MTASVMRSSANLASLFRARTVSADAARKTQKQVSSRGTYVELRY